MSEAIARYVEPNFPAIVAGNVRARAARLGLNQSGLAARLGVASNTVSLKWRGERDWKLSDLENVAEALECSPWDLTRPEGVSDASPLRSVRGGNAGTLVAVPVEFGRPTGIRTQNQRIKGPDEAVASGAMERPVLRLVS